MSDQTPNPDPTLPPTPPPPVRSGCASVIMVLLGIILLLPGLCAILLTSVVPGHIGREEVQLIAGCAVAAVAGIFLIIAALK